MLLPLILAFELLAVAAQYGLYSVLTVLNLRCYTDTVAVVDNVVLFIFGSKYNTVSTQLFSRHY